ncbi:nicotinate-nucleotide adenylyltransferase [Clostridium sp. NSJ-6]|uniref:Probable nicotinate-nucleotide adenylyltransferase n=1 Tax=Clostridium hominis TaxID=2763036 RepID=A0ABR7DEP7_9CLOT|nr:nicotinate-nucleotide adenylyltransferase [Clostridium hominis]MBC5629827.1 nicotinate-nucleotide adenylyltransferase [Clostridium hominis]
MKRYGIMGGTFNPIHLAHLYIAYEAKEQLDLDTIIFMPAGNPPHKKNKSIIDSSFRLEMVNLAIEGYKDFMVSNYEIEKQGLSFTYETLKTLKRDDVELYFIAGGDSLMDIEKWRNPDQILEDCNFVVFNRGKFSIEELEKQKIKLEEKYNANIILLNVANIDISSSMIRERLEEGKRVDFFLPNKVLKYIVDNRLYEGDLND